MTGAAPAPAPTTAASSDPEARGETGWKRTSPAGILASGVSGLGQAILPIVAVLFGTGMRDAGLVMALLVGLAIIAANFLVAALAWWRTQYRIGEADIRMHKGIVSRSARSVPFERIQDVSLEQRLVPRLLGLVEVRLETGAGGKDELKLAYVTQAEGEALRETVRARIEPGASGDAPAAPGGEAVAAQEVTPLFAMGPRRLLVFGLFEFSLVVFAVLAGAAQQFDFLLPFDLWDLDRWEQRLAGPNAILGAWLAGLGWAARIVGVLLAVLGLGLVGLATGIARTFAREWGFRLERTAKGFRRRRGLFTRTDVVMPVHRVQALTVSTGVLRRLWGWHGLSFISLAQDAGSANHAVAPFARLEEVAPIAREAGFALPYGATRWHRPNRHFRTDRAILIAALPWLAAVAALLLGQALAALAGLVLGALLAVRELLLLRFERYAIDPNQLLWRSGWLSPRLTIAARAKLHSVEISRGPLARLRGYACLEVGLAGGRLKLRGVPLDHARTLRAAVLRSITAVDFSQLPR